MRTRAKLHIQWSILFVLQSHGLSVDAVIEPLWSKSLHEFMHLFLSARML